MRNGRRRGICCNCRERGYVYTFDGRHMCRLCYNRAVASIRGLRAVTIR